jgi:hypothetical protein
VKWHAEAPVTWPDDAHWVAWWVRQRAEIDEHLAAGESGVVMVDREYAPLRLIRAGTSGVLSEGARLAPYLPNAPGLTGEIVVAGQKVTGEVRLAPDPSGLVTVGFDSLALPRSFVSRATLRYVEWDVDLSRDAATVLQAEGRLRWVRASATIVRNHDRLVFDAAVTGRGAWTVAVAALLAAVGSRMNADADASAWLTGTADAISVIAGAKRSAREAIEAQQEEDRRLIDAGLSVMTGRLREVDRRVRERPWYRSKAQSVWDATYAAMGPGTWPDRPSSLRRPWDAVEVELSDLLGRLPWRQRRDALATRVQTLRASLAPITDLVTSAPPSVPITTPSGWGGLADITDADLDLSWLRSPRTVWTHLGRQATLADELPEWPSR